MGQSLYKKGDVIDVKPCKLSVEAAHRELLVLAVANSNYVPFAEARANDPQYFPNDKYLWNIDYSKIGRPSRPDVRRIVDDVLGEEKRGTVDQAFAFSARAAQVSLMNKLTKPAPTVRKDSPLKAAVINKPVDQAEVTPTDEVGTPIKNPEKRLSLLK